MAGLAVAMFGTTAAIVGLAVGTAAATVAVFVGPRVLNIVSFYASAIALTALGCIAWFCMSNQNNASEPPLSGDLLPIVHQFSILTAAVGYAAACAIILGASALWGSAIHGGQDCAKLLICMAIVVLCIPFVP